jgi:hypothetical protein
MLIRLPDRLGSDSHPLQHSIGGTNTTNIESNEEIALVVLLNIFDNMIEEAKLTLLYDEASIFDQHHINSFVRGRSHARPLLLKLQKGNYRRYKMVWKQLLCFVYRQVVMESRPQLHSIIIDQQTTSLDHLIVASKESV